MLRWLAALLVVLAVAGAGAYVAAGRGAPPQLTILKPDRVVGQTGSLELNAVAPDARFTSLSITLEQNGRSVPLFALDSPQQASVTRAGPDQLRISRQLLYGHLSSFDVKAGDQVEKEQQIGRSGSTGMALGDHLHFTMLVNGKPVNPVEWWDPKWMQDRVFRKVAAAGGGVP